MAADGSIIIDTKINDKQAQQELNRLTKKIDGLNDKIASKNQERIPLVEQAKKLGVELDAAKATFDHMQSGSEFFPTATIDAQATKVKTLQKEWDTAQANVEKVDASINKMSGDLELSKEKAGVLSAHLAGAGDGTNYMTAAVNRADKYMSKFVNRVKGLARRVFVFTIITMALRSMRDWFGKVIKTNSEATAAIAKLKGSLLTLAQPLVNVIIPAFTAFVNVLTRIISTISRFVSTLFGTTAEDSAQAAKNLYEEQQALDGVGGAAKKASKSMASFDEINQLSGESSSSGGGGSGSGAIAPDFKSVIGGELTSIAELFTGAALLALGAILTFTGAHVLLGIGLMIIGAAAIWDAVTSNPSLAAALVERGLDTVLQVIGGLIAVIGVVLMCTGHLLLGIGMIIAGAAIFAIGTSAGDDGDFAENIKTRLTQAAQIIGPLVAVIGVFLAVTGHLILGIGMIIAGIAIFHVVSASDDNGMTLQQKIINTLSRIASDIGKMLAVLGVVMLMVGQIPKGIALLIAGISLFAVGETALNWDLLKTNTVQALSNILGAIGPFIAIIGLVLLFVPGMQAAGIGMIVAGIGAFAFSEIAPNWDFVLQKLQECWAGIKTWWNKNVAKYFTKGYWSDLGKNAINGLIEAVESGINKIIDGINSIFRALDVVPTIVKAFVGLPTTTPQISHITLPRLAQGAVIPPNREFMAVLGDQKSGTNIETPLSTMVQAFKMALAESGYSGSNEAYLVLDKDVLGKVVYKLNKSESNRIGVSLTGV